MQLTNYIHFRNLKGDIFGGITAAIIALPMALAFGVSSGAGASAGLWGAILVGFFASLFGGTPTLISEPTGPMTVVMTTVIAKLTASHPEKGMAMAFTVVMMAGCFQILFGALQLGKYITLLPYTVISGFMCGIGFILIILQIAPLLGQEEIGEVIATIQALPRLLENIDLREFGLGILTIAILFLTPQSWRRFVPPQLIALVLGTVISVVAFTNADLRRIGEVPTGLPSLQVPTFSANELQLMVFNAVVLAMLGSIDALLTSVIADSLTGTQHHSDKELMGQGLGNLASGLFGGIAGAGATMGTVANIQIGARTALSGLTRAFILLVVVLGAAQLTEKIPMAVLAGIAMKVGFDIIDWNFLKRVHQISWKGAFIMYGVIALTIFVDLITAVAAGLFIANILTIRRLSDLKAEDVKAISYADDQIVMSPEEKELLDRGNGRILLFYLSGPMIFGVSKAISRQNEMARHYDILILDVTDVPLLGVTSSLAIENVIKDAIQNDRQVIISGATGKIKDRLQRLQIADEIPQHHFVSDRLEALQLAHQFLDKETDTTTLASEQVNQ